jgi:hypothetical protein
MKAIINRHMFTESNIDSGSITMRTTVVHKFSEPGEYLGNVMKGKAVVGQFRIVVGKKPEAAAAANAKSAEMSPPAGPTQAHIDLQQMEAPAARSGQAAVANRFMVRPDGYAVFKASAGAGGYAVEVFKAGERGAKVFDSRELKGDDLLYVLVLRPGTYSVTNTLANAKAELVVAYPEKGMPRNLEPVRAESGSSSISPQRLDVKPMQGIVFSFKAPSRIKIDLVKPEDRAEVVASVKDKTQQAQSKSAKAAGKKVLRRIRITPRSASL